MVGIIKRILKNIVKNCNLRKWRIKSLGSKELQEYSLNLKK